MFYWNILKLKIYQFVYNIKCLVFMKKKFWLKSLKFLNIYSANVKNFNIIFSKMKQKLSKQNLNQ